MTELSQELDRLTMVDEQLSREIDRLEGMIHTLQRMAVVFIDRMDGLQEKIDEIHERRS